MCCRHGNMSHGSHSAVVPSVICLLRPADVSPVLFPRFHVNAAFLTGVSMFCIFFLGFLSSVQSRLSESADCRPALPHQEVPAVPVQRRALCLPSVGARLLQRQQAAQLQKLPAAFRRGAR